MSLFNNILKSYLKVYESSIYKIAYSSTAKDGLVANTATTKLSRQNNECRPYAVYDLMRDGIDRERPFLTPSMANIFTMVTDFVCDDVSKAFGEDENLFNITHNTSAQDFENYVKKLIRIAELKKTNLPTDADYCELNALRDALYEKQNNFLESFTENNK